MLKKKQFAAALTYAVALLLLTALGSVTFAQNNPAEPIKNLSFQNADIRAVLGFLAEYGQVNIVTSPEVKGNVTFAIKQVTWREALDILCKTYALSSVEEKEYIRVLPLKEYLEEVSTLEKHQSEREKLTELQTTVLEVDNAHADDLIKTVTPLLTERGKVQTDKRTNSVIIRDIPSNIAKIEALVGKLDRPTRQIKIAAQLVEVSTNALEEFGIDWSYHAKKVTASGKEYEHSATQDLDFPSPSNPGAGNFLFSTLQDGWDLNASISAMISDGKGKIIAHPEIITLDNKEAKIQMGQRIPIKQFDQAGNVVVTFEEVGTLLRVNPHITSENRILMTMKPERSSYFFDANGVVINTSNAETNVVVQNGQTAIIGGLTTQDILNTKTGIPILKDIPGLGALFSYRKEKVENRDLIIFVTPTIVDDALTTAPQPEPEGKN